LAKNLSVAGSNSCGVASTEAATSPASDDNSCIADPLLLLSRLFVTADWKDALIRRSAASVNRIPIKSATTIASRIAIQRTVRRVVFSEVEMLLTPRSLQPGKKNQEREPSLCLLVYACPCSFHLECANREAQKYRHLKKS